MAAALVRRVPRPRALACSRVESSRSLAPLSLCVLLALACVVFGDAGVQAAERRGEEGAHGAHTNGEDDSGAVEDLQGMLKKQALVLSYLRRQYKHNSETLLRVLKLPRPLNIPSPQLVLEIPQKHQLGFLRDSTPKCRATGSIEDSILVTPRRGKKSTHPTTPGSRPCAAR